METYHIMFNFSPWKNERRKMHERCEKEGEGQLRMVRQLIGSRKDTPAVLDFIAATQAGRRA